jgi:ribonucleoside-diphosphate reductase alpha chain
MRVERVFTKELVKGDKDIFSVLEWKLFDVVLKDHRSDKILFQMKGVEAPINWSQQAVDIMASNYFRRAEVPTKTKRKSERREKDMPEWLLPSVPEKDSEFRCEMSVKQVLHRLAGAWVYWAWKSELLRKDGEKELSLKHQEENAKIMYDEVVYMIYAQYAAPNSPQFFNTGLNWAYGITGSPCGHWYTDKDGKVHQSEDLYTHSQAHACFILKLEDSLFGKNGIYDNIQKEAKIFKLGSGSGMNYSKLRAEGESISGGGSSSGLMSFLKIFDRSADCIKSGGVTRRSARLLCLYDYHKDLLHFITWKQTEELKARALISVGYDSDFNGEAYKTISGQNGNNSVAASHDFMREIKNGEKHSLWWTKDVAKYTDKKGIVNFEKMKQECKQAEVHDAKAIWKKISEAAWTCADPGLQYNGTANDWNTLAEDHVIECSNPCLFGDTLICIVDENDNVKLVRIDEIKEKKLRILVYNFEKQLLETVEANNLGMTRSNSKTIKIKLKNGDHIRLTPDHEVMTRRGWVAAKDLTKEDKIYKVKKVKPVPVN